MSLRCEERQTIRILRAVWGRYSQAICPEDRSQPGSQEDRSQPGSQDVRGQPGSQPGLVMCGDRRRSQRKIASQCEGRRACELGVSQETFGDPCPGVREFLEVQYQCDEDITRGATSGERGPGLSGDIALVWGQAGSQDVDNILREKLTMYKPRVRIPITEAPTEDPGDSVLSPDQHFSQSSLLTSDLAWLIVLVLVTFLIILSLVIIKARDLSTKQQTHRFSPCLMAGQGAPGAARLVMCRPDLSLSRQFSSEPSLAPHSCLVLDSGKLR